MHRRIISESESKLLNAKTIADKLKAKMLEFQICLRIAHQQDSLKAYADFFDKGCECSVLWNQCTPYEQKYVTESMDAIFYKNNNVPEYRWPLFLTLHLRLATVKAAEKGYAPAIKVLGLELKVESAISRPEEVKAPSAPVDDLSIRAKTKNQKRRDKKRAALVSPSVAEDKISPDYIPNLNKRLERIINTVEELEAACKNLKASRAEYKEDSSFREFPRRVEELKIQIVELAKQVTMLQADKENMDLNLHNLETDVIAQFEKISRQLEVIQNTPSQASSTPAEKKTEVKEAHDPGPAEPIMDSDGVRYIPLKSSSSAMVIAYLRCPSREVLIESAQECTGSHKTAVDLVNKAESVFAVRPELTPANSRFGFSDASKKFKLENCIEVYTKTKARFIFAKRAATEREEKLLKSKIGVYTLQDVRNH